MQMTPSSRFISHFFRATGLCAVLLFSSCGGTTTPTIATTNAYAAVYKSVTWAPGVTVSFPSSCTMTVISSGVPPVHNAYYLAPSTSGSTIVATTPSGIQLSVMAYAGTVLSVVKPVSGAFNICPAKATSATPTGGGAIGAITSGEALFDPYEATATVAMSDNASYTFTNSSGTFTASFIDQCNSHAAGNMGSASWHYHANPICWTPTIDGATGASHIIGIALDGFPIYGGRDVNGNIIDPSTLDACNGITSATPEFPTGAYHYVLPLNTTTKQSSINCYAGTVSATLSAQMRRLACKMPLLLANGKMRMPDGTEITPDEAKQWMRNKAMPFISTTMIGM